MTGPRIGSAAEGGPDLLDGAAKPGRPTWGTLFAVSLASRFVLVLFGMLVSESPSKPDRPSNSSPMEVACTERVNADLAARSRKILRPWYRSDANWYAKIARCGYYSVPGGQSPTGFLPFLPMTMRAAGACGIDPYWVGLILPNLAFAVGLAFFGRLAAGEMGSPEGAWKASLLLMTFPQAVFFSAPYQESLAFALISGSLLAWRSRRPVLAALGLAAAGPARLFTISVSAAVVVEAAADLHAGRRPRRGVWLMVVAGFVGIATIIALMSVLFGDPMIHFRSHGAWGRQSPGPAALGKFAIQFGRKLSDPMLDLILLGVIAACCREIFDRFSEARRTASMRTGSWATSAWLLVAVAALAAGAFLWYSGRARGLPAELIRPFRKESDAICFVLIVALGIRAWVRRGIFWGALILLPICQAASTGSTMSMARFALMCFPAAIDAAQLFRNRGVFAAFVLVQAILQCLFARAFVNGHFVG